MMFGVREYWFTRDAQRIRGIRADTLAQMMSFANIRPRSGVIVVDDVVGLIVAGATEGLGGDSLFLSGPLGLLHHPWAAWTHATC